MDKSPPQHMTPDNILTHMFSETYGRPRDGDFPRPPAERLRGAPRSYGRPTGPLPRRTSFVCIPNSAWTNQWRTKIWKQDAPANGSVITNALPHAASINYARDVEGFLLSPAVPAAPPVPRSIGSPGGREMRASAPREYNGAIRSGRKPMSGTAPAAGLLNALLKACAQSAAAILPSLTAAPASHVRSRDARPSASGTTGPGQRERNTVAARSNVKNAAPVSPAASSGKPAARRTSAPGAGAGLLPGAGPPASPVSSRDGRRTGSSTPPGALPGCA